MSTRFEPNHRRAAAILLLILCTAGTAFGLAGTAAPSADAASAQAMALAKARLRLSEEQAAKIAPLMTAQVTKLRALFEEYTGQGVAVLPSFMQEFQATRERFRAGVDPILTEPQRLEFAFLRDEIDQALRDQICDLRVAALKDSLKLSTDQVAAVRPILLEDFERKREILSYHTGESGGPETRRPLFGEARKVQEETERRLQAVLSPEQMKSYLADRERKRDAATKAATGG